MKGMQGVCDFFEGGGGVDTYIYEDFRVGSTLEYVTRVHDNLWKEANKLFQFSATIYCLFYFRGGIFQRKVHIICDYNGKNTVSEKITGPAPKGS